MLHLKRIFKVFYSALLLAQLIGCDVSSTRKDVVKTPEVEKELSTEEKINRLTLEIEGNPGNVDLHMARYFLLEKEKKYDLAKLDAKYMLALKPDKPEHFLLVGQAHKNLGEIDSALLAANTAEQNGLQSPECYQTLGEIYLILRQYKKAGPYFDKALKLAPYKAESYLYKGLLFAEMGDTAKAISTMLTAVEQNVEYVDAYNNLATIYLKKDNLTLAEQTLKSGYRFGPEDPFVNYNIGLLLQKKNLVDSAETFFRKAILYKDDLYNAHFNLASILYSKREYTEAESEFRKAQDPKNISPIVFFNQGLCLEYLGKYQEAADVFQKVIKLNKMLVKEALVNQKRNLAYAEKANLKKDSTQKVK